MSPALSWLVLIILGATVLVVAFRVDSWAWRVREEREELKLRRRLEAYRRIYERSKK